jgi:enediyne polyketide synthase
MSPAVALVGMACRYPDARSPAELWENVLAQRRAFRQLPPERLRLGDYLSRDPGAPDCTYAGEAALIEGYEFDRLRFRVAGTSVRSADLVHWLALDIADQALADAGHAGGEGLPRETSGVLLGNTLTGEFSRANGLRLRWPYARRVVEAALLEEGWDREQRRAFLETLEARYKAPFAPVDEETLAGALSNTIAGRICNHFDLKGGGYTVDGACAASLLAVATACAALVSGDLDVALAGGVDLSLDPFELVGFAKAGALARDEMRVYDVRSTGFWPGEGCGFVVLMRHADALAEGRRIYAVIHGWGVSSDGSGGMTRPEAEGQLLAVRRAYRRAGIGIDSVAYFEGHGTGTSVGDATELGMLSRALQESGTRGSPPAIGSIKANIGHTKAAAGIAGLIKATMALHAQVIPPTTACERPRAELTGASALLRAPMEPEPWPADRPLRAGVSAMGFGGINTHVVLDAGPAERRLRLGAGERRFRASAQDAELFLLSARTVGDLRGQVDRLSAYAARLSRAELLDLAAELERVLDGGPVRAALVASRPEDFASGLRTLQEWLAGGVDVRLDTAAGVFLGAATAEPRIGFLFPGQGSPAHLDGGVWRRRFEFVRDLYARADLPTSGEGTHTAVAQPAIVTASMAGLAVLEVLGIRACVAAGHSLGELTALHWAGVLERDTLLRIAAARGRAMADLGSPAGAMASIAGAPDEVRALLAGTPVVIAGLNSPSQTVVSGEADAVEAVVTRAEARGLRAMPLPVSHAFHSPLVAAAVPAFRQHLAGERFEPLQRLVVSTVTGAPLDPRQDLPALLCRQVTSPVRFAEATAAVLERVDLLIEVGPGHVLSGLVASMAETPVLAIDAAGASLRGLLLAAGASFALGAPVDHHALFADRLVRRFDLDWRPRFFENPCERAPVADEAEVGPRVEAPAAPAPAPASADTEMPASALAIVSQLVAQRAELPLPAVREESRLLGDLHLNSIMVGLLVAEAARCLGLSPPAALTDWARATVGEVARGLEDLRRTGSAALPPGPEAAPPGVDTWIRAFTVEMVERPLPRRPPASMRDSSGGGIGGGGTGWRVIAPPQHPLAGAIGRELSQAGGDGVVLCLPPEPSERDVGLMLEAAHATLRRPGGARFVLVQHGGGGAAFARTLHLEAPDVTTCVIDVPLDHPEAARWVVAEATAASRHVEAHYDGSGCRREPTLRVLPLDPPGSPEDAPGVVGLSPADVLLVTGGGKGIAAECALALARETGVRLLLMGRSRPTDDRELATNLERMAGAGVEFRYSAADVTDAEAVRTAIAAAEAELGPVTAILHGAGANVPRLIEQLDEAAVRQTLAPKVAGARNVLAALDPARLRLFLSFGSIIARTGLQGEADYALANEWLTRLTERWQAEHPHCRCLTVEWSVWSGTGMGERLGRIDALTRAGITPIAPDEGVSILRALLARRLPQTSVVVTGRFGDPPTARLERPDLPFLRFLERPRVYYPGVELIADAEVSGENDPYLDDHRFQGQRLMPAVIGLEAMAQVAMAVAGRAEPPRFEDVRFDRSIVVPDGAPITIRSAALVRESGRVEVVLRSQETAFKVDHFRATCRFAASAEGPDLADAGLVEPTSESAPSVTGESPPGGLDPDADLYEGLLFQRGRFRRVGRYRLLRATGCVVEIDDAAVPAWFGRYLPPSLVLGDAGARDAAVHAIQACIPHATLLPVGVERLVLFEIAPSGGRLGRARERSRGGDLFTYDVDVVGADGRRLERWQGLRLKVIGEAAPPTGWVAALLGPYVERRAAELIPGSAMAVAVDRATALAADGAGVGERQARSDRAIQRLLWVTSQIQRRPDGKPEIVGPSGLAVSAAHADDLTLAVAGRGPVGCDLEPVLARPLAEWADLLGPERWSLVEVAARETGEDIDAAAIRVWAAGESLMKAGASVGAPLTFVTSTSDGWILFGAGPLIAATVITRVRGAANRLALAVLARSDEIRCEPTSTGTWSASRRPTCSATSTT